MGTDFLPIFTAQAIAQEKIADPHREHVKLEQPGVLAHLVRDLVKLFHRTF